MRATESLPHPTSGSTGPSAGGVETIRQTVADIVAPLARLHAELARHWDLDLDMARARTRLRGGVAAFEPLDVIAAAGDLLPPYVRATVALERAGLATDPEAREARERGRQVMRLVVAWLGGEPAPRDGARATARRAAALVAGSVLRGATDRLRSAPPEEDARWTRERLDEWQRPGCPCCGGTPEFSVRHDDRRVLVCSRCDSTWRTPSLGCLGCGSREESTIARIRSAAIGFELAICNSCGRYVKEPLEARPIEPLVDRALTAELDAAAEARGLRL